MFGNVTVKFTVRLLFTVLLPEPVARRSSAKSCNEKTLKNQRKTRMLESPF